ncbi:MAG: hypothetical protein SFY67_04405 [Candidatus Melainabacteria bacterium]|nr:hypothetical protein [Candidatus Melainabacteria bacterium]
MSEKITFIDVDATEDLLLMGAKNKTQDASCDASRQSRTKTTTRRENE